MSLKTKLVDLIDDLMFNFELVDFPHFVWTNISIYLANF